MKIHELPGDPGARQKKKRLGRGHGSGHGKTSGRGHKGQGARSGGGTNRGFEGGQVPLQRRLPKIGFTNHFRVEYEAINVSQLEKYFDDGATVDRAALEKVRLVRTNNPVKLLGNGSLSKKLTVRVDKASASAAKKVSDAGGSFEAIK